SKQDHSKSDCLWVTVMSHGGKNGKIYSSDKHYHVEELWENFLGDKCESLVGKPKMFFIQACRGDKVDPGAVEADGVDTVSKKIRIPQFADLLVMYSTFDLHFAYRHTLKGSWFIQALCEELNVEKLKTNLHGDFLNMLTRVNKRVANKNWAGDLAGKKQMPIIVSMLTKTLCFTPNKPKQNQSIRNNNENLLDSIPHSADYLVMYSTTEGYSSFHSETDGSKFIQAICEEFKPILQDDLFTILTRVNKKVAFAAQSNTTDKLIVGTQMANIESTLTKTFYLTPSETKSDLHYDFSNVNRGIALIFNHEYFNDKPRRIGAKKDGDDLKAVLKELQFDVKEYMDLKLDEIKKVLLDVSKQDHSKSDCLWVTVMSHGGKNGKIYSTDEHYQVEELWKNFLGEKCKSLVGKPKLFFIQACRGDKIDKGVVFVDGEDDVMMKRTIPQFADLLVMYSTFEEHYAFRSPNYGTWFIQTLCTELKADSYDDLMHILAKVNRKVADKEVSQIKDNLKFKDAKQIPYIESTLRKSIIFFNKSSMTDK
ncbi:unnamed protein product, partial [Diamesa tonsa]